MQPLAVHEIVRECWTYLLDRRRELVQACGLWFVLLLLIGVIVRGMTGPIDLAEPAADTAALALPQGIGALLVLKAAEVLVIAAVSVALHRALLLGEALPPVLAIGRRSVRYALRMTGVLLASMVPVMAIVLAVMMVAGEGPAALQFAILPGMFAMLLVLCRLHPVLPATALDAKQSFATAWDRTRNQGFRLLLGSIILLAPVMVGGTLILLLIGNLFAPVPILRNLPQAVALSSDLLEGCLLAIYFSLTWRRLAPPDLPSANAAA